MSAQRITFLISFLFFLFVFSQAQTPLFKNYSVKDGLPSSETYEIFQDSKGYIWIATDGGVSRYDGYEFKNFTTEDGLPNNVNFGFYEDPKGRIWLKSYTDKLCCYFNGKFNTLSFKSEFSNSDKYRICNSLYVDDTDTLWIGFERENNFLKIGLNDSLKHLNIQALPLNANLIYFKKIKKNGFIYGSTGTQGKKGDQIAFKYLNEKGSPVITIDSVLYNRSSSAPITRVSKAKGNTFFITRDNSIHEFNLDSSINLRFVPFEILSTKVDHANNLWVGTRNKGVLCFYDNNFDKFRTFLNGFSVTSMMVDHEGGYWFSTLENGVYYSPNINFHNYTQKDGLSINKINCISISPKNKLWLGLNNGIITCIENGNQLKDFNTNFFPNFVNNISCIQSINNEFIVSGGKLLSSIKNEKTVSMLLTDSKQLFQVKKILPTLDGLMALGYKSLYEISLSQNDYKIKKNITFQHRLYSLLNSKSGTIWLGTPNGLLKYDLNTVSNQLEKNIDFRIDDLKEDKNSYVWAASKGKGIAVIKDDSVFFINKAKGLTSDYCSNLFIDSDNVIWAGTNNGVSKITLKSYKPFRYEIENFCAAQGLISNEINQILVKGDSVYLATNDGLSIFNKKHIKTSKAEVPLYIDQFQVNDSVYSLKDNYALNYDQNFIKINFIALSYKNPGNTEYKYRLIGLDTTWQLTKSTFVNFTTLPYGNYRFELLAKNNDGFWNTKPATILFTIAPPFWHTWWFRILAGVFIIFLIYLFIKYRIRIVESRANEKTVLYQRAAEAEKEKLGLYQKATDMEMRFLGSQMNPHFTFNAMNSIQKFILDKDPLSAQRYLAQYSKLIRRVLENNMKSFVKLEQEIEMLELYLEIESARFEKKFDFEISRSNELEEDEFEIPPMIIQPYVENAIWHGLSNKENGTGKISLSFTLEKECIKCVIEDNGIGREKASLLKAKKEHTSVGMLITTQRLQKLHSDEYLGIQNEISDLKDDDGNALGTRVVVYLPIKNTH